VSFSRLLSKPGTQCLELREKVFQTLGFSSDTFDTESGVRPPTTDVSLPQGKQNRARLLRAWAEIGSWVANYERIHGRSFFIPVVGL
jgi:ubiquitin carboxyl-terminal hydrolase 25/28